MRGLRQAPFTFLREIKSDNEVEASILGPYKNNVYCAALMEEQVPESNQAPAPGV